LIHIVQEGGKTCFGGGGGKGSSQEEPCNKKIMRSPTGRRRIDTGEDTESNHLLFWVG